MKAYLKFLHAVVEHFVWKFLEYILFVCKFYANVWWYLKTENIPQDSEANKEKKSTFQQRSEHPCPLSSSIYYGSQEDMYVKSSSAQASESYPTVSP